MEFKQVPLQALEINKRYKIMYQDGYAYLFAKLHSMDLDSMEDTLVFHNTSYRFEEKAKVYISPYALHVIAKKNLSRAIFYIPNNKELVQQSMEKRALNKILQKLIGDPHFEWL
jgi:hypothetical protein